MKERNLSLKHELIGQIAVLAVTGSIASVHDVISSAAKDYKKICYVSISKPYNSFSDYFKINKIDPNKFFFIDCITKSVVKKPESTKNCVFVSGPAAFEEITNVIQKTLQENKFDLLIFDSLSSLLIYEKERFVTRFLHGSAAMIKSFHNKAVFIVLEDDTGMDLARNMGMLMDKTLYLI